MYEYSVSFFIIVFTTSMLPVQCYLPCVARQEQAGYVCVCNNTYCDTVDPPARLKHGHYHLYTTSKDNPGFTHKTGRFHEKKQRLGIDISRDIYMWINTSVKYQTFTGVGGGITDSVGEIFNTLPPGAQQRFIESFFGKSGIEYTFARVPIAGSDFSPRFYTYDDVPGDEQLSYFNLTEEDFKLKIPLIRQAMQASERGLKLLGSSWTCPVWMKTNNAPKQGYLLRKYEETYARYHLKFLEEYRKHGIEWWGLTIGNELIIALVMGSFFPMQNVIMMPYQANRWMKHYFGPLLKTNNFDQVKILTLDDERPFMSWWNNRTMADGHAAKYIDGTALHWYLDSNDTLRRLDEYRKRFPDKLLMYTESSINSMFNGEPPFPLGGWNRGVRYLNNIYQNWAHWVSSYIDWNIALDQSGGPVYYGHNLKLDSSVVINTTCGEFYKQPIFYVLGHFSKFFPPGSQRVQVIMKQDTVNSPGDCIFEEQALLELRKKISRIHLGQHLDTRWADNINRGYAAPANISYQPDWHTRPTRPMPTRPKPTRPTNPIQSTSPPTGGPAPTGKTSPMGASPPTAGPTPTSRPFPTRKPDPPSNTIVALAASYENGTISIIVHNPRAETVNLIVEDPLVGKLERAIEANSLNTFVYWQ